jgi:hypothetical protein
MPTVISPICSTAVRLKNENRRTSVGLLCAIFVSCVLTVSNVRAQTTSVPVTSVAVSSQIWPKSALNDGNLGSLWSSNVGRNPYRTEWIAYWFNSFHPINYIKLRPRFHQSALGFPVNFTIYWSDGNQWHHADTKQNFHAPAQNEWIVLPLPSTVQANGIHIVATVLGQDDVGNSLFQLAEVGAGYDSGFAQLRYVGNNGHQPQNVFLNVGSGQFNHSMLTNWNFDVRRPLIAAQFPAHPGERSNIYGASVVANGATFWNIYFGGWDGTTDGKDRISVLTTGDNFETFSGHHMVINHGEYSHVNNVSALKLSDSDWRLYYTTGIEQNGSTVNKPAVSRTPDGVNNMIPNAGVSAARLTMAGYRDPAHGSSVPPQPAVDWARADVNGSNVVYFENGTFHLYFNDIVHYPSGQQFGVHHATSVDGFNFNYQGLALDYRSHFLVANDMKSFTYNSAKYYLAGYHYNGGNLFYGVSTDLSQLSVQPFLTHKDGNDAHMVSLGYVTQANRLYGLLYGASGVSSLDQNAIYGAWLQKKVIFQNANVRWGDAVDAHGPDKILMPMSGVQTGRFYVYDSDGQTLLMTSPLVTIQQGDVWRYAP